MLAIHRCALERRRLGATLSLPITRTLATTTFRSLRLAASTVTSKLRAARFYDPQTTASLRDEVYADKTTIRGRDRYRTDVSSSSRFGPGCNAKLALISRDWLCPDFLLVFTDPQRGLNANSCKAMYQPSLPLPPPSSITRFLHVHGPIRRFESEPAPSVPPSSAF